MNKEILKYPQFVDYVLNHIEDYLNDDTIRDIELVPAVKNNEIVTDALKVSYRDCPARPLLYLGAYFEEYCQDADIEQVMTQIAGGCGKDVLCRDMLEPWELENFERVRGQIVMRLINAPRNMAMLNACPHRYICDLAITYRILTGQNSFGISTALISREMMERWGVGEEDLYVLACKNSRCLFPPVIKNMREVLKEMMPDEDCLKLLAPQSDRQMYILTNSHRINGACSICYTDILDGFARTQGHDFYILPSSIHEVILVTDETDLDVLHLEQIVGEANQTFVQADEILSDHVYYYSRDQHKIINCTGRKEGNLL